MLLHAKEISHFPKSDLKRIKKSIEDKLTTRPEVFGRPLRFSLKGHRSLRVGEYRVIYRIDKHEVKVLLIAHRSIVYQEYEKLL